MEGTTQPEVVAQPASPSFPLTGVSLDGEASAVWETAAWIGLLSTDDALRSYTTLLSALLHGQDELGRWLLRYARSAGIGVARIDGARGVTPALLRDVRARQERGETASGKTQWTSSVRQLGEKAAALARQTGAAQLGVRHLFGAYLHEIPSVHRSQLEEWRVDPQRESSALLRQVKARQPQELGAWVERHRSSFSAAPDLEAEDPLPRPGVSGYAADTPEGQDQLDIEDDVYALSALVCSTRVEPPLSIGLFGDWGSGKSFFIRQLQRGVSRISSVARASDRLQKDVPFFKQVVQIEFNAWNYSGGNLWASLVQHILDNLKLSPDEGQDLVAGRRARLQAEMELQREVQRVAEASATEAGRKVAEANRELEAKRSEHVARVEALRAVVASDVVGAVELDPDTVRQLNELREQLGLPAVAGGAAELLSALEGTRAVLRRATALFELVPREQRPRFLLASAGVLVGPVVAAVVVGALAEWLAPRVAGIAAVASWLSTALTSGAGWLRQRTRVLGDQVARLEKLQAAARRRVAAEEQRHRAEVALLEKQIALAHDEVVTAQARRQQALAQLERTQAQLAATTPASVLADFVRERSESSDYRRYLGLPAIIRRDFEAISRMIALENARLAGMSTLEEERRGAELRMNRIVLYVDDLDRCSEALVVDVLRAVHLLLAFPLFVVVVAVDARWVSRSLATHFPGLLSPAADGEARPPGGNASPMDYLEKIFQIPFWLRQPSEGAVKQMLRSLMRESEAGEASRGDDGAHGKPEGVAAPAGGGAPAPGAALGAAAATPGDPVFRHREHDPMARALDLHAEESDYVARLAPLLDRTPRSLKRFVNVYRVLKASLPPPELDDFLEGDGPLGAPYRSVLLLLAVESGLPEVSAAMLEALLATPVEGPAPSLGQVVDRLGVAPAEPPAGLPRLATWLDRECAGWRDADPRPFLAWVPRVARYSYQLHRAATRA
jgi:hypothetical protein